jgi:hypothetical protein
MCGNGLRIYVLQGTLGSQHTTFDPVDGHWYEIIHLLPHSVQRQGRKGKRASKEYGDSTKYHAVSSALELSNTSSARKYNCHTPPLQARMEPWRSRRQRAALFSKGLLCHFVKLCQSSVERCNRNSSNETGKIMYLNFFAFLRRISALNIHTQCFIWLVECELKILTISTYSRDFHGYPFHWCTSIH